MEPQKILNLLNDSSNEESKFATKKWYVIDNQTAKNKYIQNILSKLKKWVLNQVCDYSDAFILGTGDTLVTANNKTNVAFKNMFNDVFVDEANLHCNAYVQFDWI